MGDPTKASIVATLAKQDRRPAKHTRRTLERLFAILLSLLREYGRVRVPGFGVFRVRVLRRRKVVNVNDGETVQLPRARTIKFRKEKGVKV